MIPYHGFEDAFIEGSNCRDRFSNGPFADESYIKGNESIVSSNGSFRTETSNTL
jgi:hypothetical protein